MQAGLGLQDGLATVNPAAGPAYAAGTTIDAIGRDKLAATMALSRDALLQSIMPSRLVSRLLTLLK